MSDDNEFKNIDDIIEEDNIPMTPYVNEKVKYYMIALIVVLSVASALLVLLGPSEGHKTAEPAKTAETVIHK